MTNQIVDFASHFDEQRFPTAVYFHVLQQIRGAKTPVELGGGLEHALAWKDGKVQLSEKGSFQTAQGIPYQVGATRPNTLADHHKVIFAQQHFFDWAADIKKLNSFDISAIEDLQCRFGLWNSMVIPAFVLHCLRPEVFPIIDRWVVAAWCILDPNFTGDSLPSMTKLNTYQRYQQWWCKLLSEHGLNPLTSALSDLKRMDAAVWSFGKRAAVLLKNSQDYQNESSDDVADEQPRASKQERATANEAEQLRQLAIKLVHGGATQRAALKQAAQELGVVLKPSYEQYPGSHFDRWRKQGYFIK